MTADLATRVALRAAFYDLHPEGLEGFVKERRQAHMSWEAIAVDIETACGCQYNSRTIHRMFANKPWAAEKIRWWDSPAVVARREARKAARMEPALKAAE